MHRKLPYVLLLCWSLVLSAQTIDPILTDLSAPIDVTIDHQGNAWITDAGTGNNDGSIIRFSPLGAPDTIIQGLPSFFDPLSQELQGPLSARLLADGRIFVNQGAGPDTLSASILEFHLDDYATASGALTASDLRSAVCVGNWALSQGYSQSNPYSFVIRENGQYLISDAAANAIFSYDPVSDSLSLFVELPFLPNPLPFGPPFLEAVPTKIIAHPAGGWLVGTLTGFPFPDGGAKVFRLHPDGSLETYAEGLALITDLDFDPEDGHLLVQQFARFGMVDSSFAFLFNSAQLIKVLPDGSLDTLVQNFGPSPGLAVAADGSVYLTHLFLGQLLRVSGLPSAVSKQRLPSQSMEVFPNPIHHGRLTASVELRKSSQLFYELVGPAGRLLQRGRLGYYPTGTHPLSLDLNFLPRLSGMATLRIVADQQIFTAKLMLR